MSKLEQYSLTNNKKEQKRKKKTLNCEDIQEKVNLLTLALILIMRIGLLR